MNQITLALSCASLLVGTSAAQSHAGRTLTSLEGNQVNYIGTYHVASGQLIAPSAASFSGPTLDDPIYNNSAFTGSFSNIIDGTTVIDEGRIPSTSSVGVVGTQDNYEVTGFQMGYATNATDPSIGGTGVSFRLDFYDSWAACGAPSTSPAPIYSIVIGPLAGSTTPGSIAAFFVDIDTTGTGFCIRADGDGAFSMGSDDLFGWGITIADAGDATSMGPLTAGGPASAGLEGDGTVFQNPASPGSGLSTRDLFSDIDAAGVESCLFFGGTPFASFWMLLRSDLAGECIIGSDLCAGVVNSTGDGAILRSSGSDVALDNALILNTTGLPLNSMGYYIVSQDTNVVMNPGGSAGNICIASLSIGRYAGSVINSGAAGQAGFAPDLTAIPLATGGGPASVAGMAGDTFNFQFWYRDTDGMGAPTSNFSSATSITLQ